MTSLQADPSRILVTGSEGFVGRWLLQALADRLAPGSRILRTTRRSGGRTGAAALPGDEAVLDITDRDAVRHHVGAFRPTGIVHLAAVASIGDARRDTRGAWEINLTGTLHLAEAVRDEAPEARFVFAGTSEAYGGSFARRSGPVDEDTPLDPANTYAASKAAADLLLGQMARDGLRSVRMRPFNHTGPGQSDSYVIPAFASQIARIEAGLQPAVLRVGNLGAIRDFLDVRDVVDGYVRALLAPDLPAGTVLNLASGVPRRIGDVLQALVAASGAAVRIEPDPARMRPSEIPVAIGSGARAAALLGWAPQIPFDRTLRDVLDGCRASLRRNP